MQQQRAELLVPPSVLLTAAKLRRDGHLYTAVRRFLYSRSTELGGGERGHIVGSDYRFIHLSHPCGSRDRAYGIVRSGFDRHGDVFTRKVKVWRTSPGVLVAVMFIYLIFWLIF